MMASDAEVLRLIEASGLVACGIGYIDAHLLAATRLTFGVKFWALDKRLSVIADYLGLTAAAPLTPPGWCEFRRQGRPRRRG